MLIYKNGEASSEGDLIRWYVFDEDDNTIWTFTGIVKKDGVMYLCGGIDFSKGFGKIISFDVVKEQASYDDESYQAGVSKIGTVMDVTKLIGINFKGK